MGVEHVVISHDWSSSCGCPCAPQCDVCLYGCFCPCCLYGYVANNADGSSCCCMCFLYGLCWPFTCIFAGATRRQIRVKYGLPPDPCSDCCVHIPLWSAFGLCQEAKEINFRLHNQPQPAFNPVVADNMQMTRAK